MELRSLLIISEKMLFMKEQNKFSLLTLYLHFVYLIILPFNGILIF